MTERFIRETVNSPGFHGQIIYQCPHMVPLHKSLSLLIKDVDDFVEGKWSSFTDDDYCVRTAFFELESDAMAFKLRWA